MRLDKELRNVEAEIRRGEGMLANAGFVAKAPKALVEAEQSKLEANREKRNKILANIESLK